MKSNDLSNDIQAEANSRGLIIEVQMLREYFGIEYTNNLRDILQ